MDESTNRKSRSRKTISAVLAIAMVLTMLLSGTLAYFYSARATNTLYNASKAVVGHDDFALVSSNGEGYFQKWNKDIYAENAGGTAVYVRVKLTEDFTLDGKAQVTSPVAHIPAAGADGAAADVTTHAKGEGSTDKIHDYFTWDMGRGTGFDNTRTYFLSGTSEKYGDPNYPELTINEDGVVQDASTDFSAYVTAIGAGDKQIKSISAGNVMLMSEYIELGDKQKNYTGWIIDDSPAVTEGSKKYPAGNGWAYWSQKLMPGQNTAMLLNGITVAEELANRRYTYNVYVDFEAVDKDDKGIWHGEKDTDTADIDRSGVEHVSKNAEAMLNAIDSFSVSEAMESKIAEVVEKAKSAESASAALIYETALANVNSATDPNGTFAQERLTTYTQIADDLEQRKKDKDPTLKDVVLAAKRDGTGAITGILDTYEGKACKITNMPDVNIVKYFIDNYDLNHDNILTEEEALGVTDVLLSGNNDGNYTVSHNVSDLTGLEKKYFKNLQSVSLKRLDALKKINTENFVIKNAAGEVTEGIYRLNLSELFALDSTHEIDLSILKKDLREISLGEIRGETVNITGFNQLEKLRRIVLSNWNDFGGHPSRNYVLLADLQAVLDNSPDLEILNLYNFDLSGDKTAASVAGLNLGGCTNLREFYCRRVCNSSTQPLDLSGCAALKTVDVGGLSTGKELYVTLPQNTPATVTIFENRDAFTHITYKAPTP